MTTGTTTDSPTTDRGADIDLGYDRRLVTVDRLLIDGLNMRYEHKLDPSLMASIVAHGQLNDLIVRPRTGDDDPGAPHYEIVDGGRRFTAILQAIKEDLLPLDYRVSVRVDDSATKEISVAANLHMAPHPLDVCEAIHELAKTAEDEDAIANHFGQSRTWVWQRSKLAQLSDKAKQAYRNGRFDLGVAQQLTRLTAKQQDALCKGKDRIDGNMVRGLIYDIGIDSELALFDWKTLYPKDKTQGSLFDDVTMLLDRDLFIQLQENAVSDAIKSYEEEGYTVVRIPKDDYTLEGKYVAFTGTPTAEQKKTLSILVRPKHDGLSWTFRGPSLLARQAARVKKVEGGSDTTDQPPRPMKATELSPAQTEILNAHIVADVRRQIIAGEPGDALVQWTVIAQSWGLDCRWVGPGIAPAHNGTASRWLRLEKDYPGELRVTGVEMPGRDLTFERFCALPPKDRTAIYLRAVADLCMVPNDVQTPHLATAKGVGISQIMPGEAFFKRYRTDQLLDYLKRSGITKKSGGLPEDGKKSSAVACAVATAALEGAWQFGIKAK